MYADDIYSCVPVLPMLVFYQLIYSSAYSNTGVVPFIVLLFVVECSARPLYPLPSKKDRQPLQTFRPYNIAHRGSNGEIPEETAAAYLVSSQHIHVPIMSLILQSIHLPCGSPYERF